MYISTIFAGILAFLIGAFVSKTQIEDFCTDEYPNSINVIREGFVKWSRYSLIYYTIFGTVSILFYLTLSNTITIKGFEGDSSINPFLLAIFAGISYKSFLTVSFFTITINDKKEAFNIKLILEIFKVRELSVKICEDAFIQLENFIEPYESKIKDSISNNDDLIDKVLEDADRFLSFRGRSRDEITIIKNEESTHFDTLLLYLRLFGKKRFIRFCDGISS